MTTDNIKTHTHNFYDSKSFYFCKSNSHRELCLLTTLRYTRKTTIAAIFEEYENLKNLKTLPAKCRMLNYIFQSVEGTE